MPAKTRRFWHCTKGHILGEFRKVSSRVTGNKIVALMLYENSELSVDHVPDELPPLRQRLIGDALDVRCTICLHTRDYNMDEDALDQLMSTRAKMNAVRV